MDKRTTYCGLVTKEYVGQEVTLSGWVQKRRDLGGLIFIDLRDREGYVQIVFNPDESKEALAIAEKVRGEYVVTIKGKVVERHESQINRKLKTGEIEILASSIEILNVAKTTPFYIEDGVEVSDDLRLKYRYLDLRRPEMSKIIRTRHDIKRAVRDTLDDLGFIDIETPMLNKSTPEGARDYLVPSRVHPGHFYALPQSPQLNKQLLMSAGFDKYYQIVRCFRDEDLRGDRQPEFTQIDIETSFQSAEDIQTMTENLLKAVVKKLKALIFRHHFHVWSTMRLWRVTEVINLMSALVLSYKMSQILSLILISKSFHKQLKMADKLKPLTLLVVEKLIHVNKLMR